MSIECSLKRYAITLMAFGELPDLSRIERMRCVSSNHKDCFEACIDEFKVQERLLLLIREALEVGDLDLLRRLNEYKEFKRVMKISEPYSLEVIRFLREEMGLSWSNHFIKHCMKGAEYEVVKYALEDGCTCVPWRLKMLLYTYPEQLKRGDEWLQTVLMTL